MRFAYPSFRRRDYTLFRVRRARGQVEIFKNFFRPHHPSSAPAPPPKPRRPLILLTIVGSVPKFWGNGERGMGNGEAGKKKFSSTPISPPLAPFPTPARLCGKAGFSDLVGARVSHPRFQSRDFGRVQFRERETPPDYSVRLGMSCHQRQLSQILRQLGTLFLSELFPSIEHDWRTAFICTSKFPSTARSEQEGIQHYSAIPPPFVE